MAAETYRAKKGLEGVIFDESSVSNVVPEQKALYYRGYPVHELAEKCSFEEVAHLLLVGELPTRAELDAFTAEERAARGVPRSLLEVIERYPPGGHPMDAVRTGVSYLGMEEEFAGADDPASAIRKGKLLLAKIPTLIAAARRASRGEPILDPREDLSISENFFHMCFAEVPEPEVVSAFDGSLTLYAEHGFNASTFTARVIVSTQSDLCGAVSGAIASLKGSLHGGANEAVMHMLEEIGTADQAEAWLADALAQKKKIMGFGHRLYRHGDSRVPTMTSYRDQMVALRGGQEWQAISHVLEEGMVGQKGIHPNLDFPAGPVYHLMGFERELFTPIFVMARVVGWTAHVAEQLSDNRLVRPKAEYVGPAERPVPSIEERV